LGTEQPQVHKQMKTEISELPRDEFALLFLLDAKNNEAYANGRFKALNDLDEFHRLIEISTNNRRNELVADLAKRINEPEAREKLTALRPLSLTGLRKAREDGDTGAIDAEIATILET